MPRLLTATGTLASETTGIVPRADCRLLWNTTAPVKNPGLAGAGTLTVNVAVLPGRTILEAGLTAWRTLWKVCAVSSKLTAPS